MTRYEFRDEKSSKFWEIKRSGSKLTVSFGKIQTKGQSQIKEFGSAQEAKSEYDRLVKEKTKTGYLEANTKPRKESSALLQIADPKAGTNFKASPGTSAKVLTVLLAQFSPLLKYSIEIPKGFLVSCEKEKDDVSLQVYAVNKRGAHTNTLLTFNCHVRKGTTKDAALKKYACDKWKIEPIPYSPAIPFVDAKLKNGHTAKQISIFKTFKVPFNTTKVQKVSIDGIEFYQCTSTQKRKTLNGSDWCELIGQDQTRLLTLTIRSTAGSRENFELGSQVLRTFRKTK